METGLITIVGFIAAFFSSITALPQVIRIYKTKETDGLSIFMYVFYITGLVLWISYGLLKKDMALIISSSISLTFGLFVTYYIISNLRNKKL